MFRNNFAQLLFFSILLPISIYLFIMVPFSSFVDLSLVGNINFFVWGSIGLMIVSTLIMSIFVTYLESGRLLMKDYFASIFVSRITIVDIVGSLILWSTLASFFQFLISMLIVKGLVPEFYITLIDFFYFVLLALITCFFLSSFWVAVYIALDKSSLTKLITTIFLILFFSFGLGLFIPASEKYYTLEYIDIIKKIPLSLMIQNFQNIVLNKSINLLNLTFVFLLSIFFSFVSVYLLEKRSIR